MRILVGYDGSTSADAAIEDLRRAGLPEEIEVLVVCVADDWFPVIEGPERPQNSTLWKSRTGEAERLAEKACARIRSCFPASMVSSRGLFGSPAKIILETADWWRPDLLVVGSHGRSPVARFFLGSVSMELLHKARCSVRVTRSDRPSKEGAPIRLVVGHDGSEEADAVIRSIAARSWPDKTEAKVVSAVQTLVPAVTALEANTFAQEPAYSLICEADERMRFRLENIASESANVLRRAGLLVTSSVVDGDPREAILTAAEYLGADAILVGARGLGRMERLFLGSVSTHVVAHAGCTVEVVRRHPV